MTEVWRLLDTGPRSAAENMALDEVVLTARSRGRVPNTLRFLQFSPPCVLVGYHQAVEQEVRVGYCREHGIEINRRLTGGGALYWDESQLGWEIFAGKEEARFPRRVEDLYRLMCDAAVCGLAKLGIKAAFRPKNDIEVNGRKISGTGGTSLGGAFLFQGTLLVDFDADTMIRALRIPTEKLKDKEIRSVKERVTCLAWELPTLPSLDQIKSALVAGFSEALGVTFAPAPLGAREEELLAQRLGHFRSDEWINGTRRPLAGRSELRALRKSPGGLVRVSLVVAGARSPRIREVFITGDFFAYPRRAILDLEARLKDVPADPRTIERIIEGFFADEEVQIPGVTARDFVQTVGEALDKLTYTRHGIPRDEVNSVFPVVRPLPEITHCPVLLLPYCAKLPQCEYRFRDGCAQCGQCCIGDAYRIAEEHGMRPISIQNYEMLEEMLADLKRQGVPAFAGSCCEAFYAKHRSDFERIGLPGILVDVDNTTCYDLGREEDAYAGRFENQTYLKLDLIERVVRRVGPKHLPTPAAAAEEKETTASPDVGVSREYARAG